MYERISRWYTPDFGSIPSRCSPFCSFWSIFFFLRLFLLSFSFASLFYKCMYRRDVISPHTANVSDPLAVCREQLSTKTFATFSKEPLLLFTSSFWVWAAPSTILRVKKLASKLHVQSVNFAAKLVHTRRALSSTVMNSHQDPVSGQACNPPDPH